MTTNIEWVKNPDGSKGETWNPIAGCSRVSKGCEGCYAEIMANRLQAIGIKGYDGVIKNKKWTGKINLIPDKLNLPLHWKKSKKIFVNSMSDLFHEKVSEKFIWEIFLRMALVKRHTFQVLTKHPERMLKILAENKDFLQFIHPFLKNVHLGVSVENQETADERIPLLLKTPAAVRWVSVEPMLESIDFHNIGGLSEDEILFRLGWIVVGCESGVKRRECKIEWVESIVNQCKSAGVSVFVKQLQINGKVEKDINKFPKHLQIREYPE